MQKAGSTLRGDCNPQSLNKYHYAYNNPLKRSPACHFGQLTVSLAPVANPDSRLPGRFTVDELPKALRNRSSEHV